MKKLIMTFVICLICFFTFDITVFASSSNYKITKYDVNINVNSNNSYDITEDIKVHFNISQHGIYRKIPTINKIERADGSKATSKAIISDFVLKSTSNSPYSIKKDRSSQTYKIGDPNKFENENAEYLLKYNYDLGEDNNKKFDELYFNIIGPEWDSSISNVTFTITMPEDFDANKLGFTYGLKGSSNTENITYSVDGNVITGKFNGTLMPKEALTVRLELPEGYFYGERKNKNPYKSFIFLLPIFVVISFAMWVLFGRDKKVFPSVQFYPPEGYNSAEVAFLYKGKVESSNVVSLIVYLASKGYLKIIETEIPSLLGTKTSFLLEKIKEYDGNNASEEIIFNGLFSENIIVGPSDLRYTFYRYINAAKRVIETNDNKNMIFERTSRIIKPITIILAIISLILIFIPLSEVAYGSATGVFFPVVFPTVGFLFFFNAIKNKRSNVNSIIGSLIFLLFSLVIIFIFFVFQPLQENGNFIPYFIIGIICSVILFACVSISLKRTDFGNDILGRIIGFKNFLKVAEKDDINQLANENPEYFYDILPFAYVLGVSDTWINKFESIALEPPSWYHSSTGYFSASAFCNSFLSVMDNVNSSATSTPSSSGGGSSGGGSSGGGSGGGGGGSW